VHLAAFAELNERGDRCMVIFRYSQEHVDAMHRIPGSRFVPLDKAGSVGQAHWTLPLDLDVMRTLRKEFNDGLELGNAIKAWGRAQVKKEQSLQSLSVTDDVPLGKLLLDKKLPDLAEWLRKYQRADVKFMATTNCLNLNEPRLGKTTEVIGAVYEAGIEKLPQLVVAPKSTLDEVWRMEVERWTKDTVVTYHGDLNRREKADAERTVERCLDKGRPFWFITTADMIRRESYPGADQVKTWGSLTIDEFHKTGLPEVSNVFPKKAGKIPAERKYALSGTPMGGKPIKLWGGLHFIEPDQYTSKWTWAAQWLVIETVWGNHKNIGGIKKGREDDFYKMLAKHAIRRLRKEEFPDLPEKQWIDVDCPMTPKQAKQYKEFAKQAEIRIDEYHLSATSVLAEYVRLKQFANHMNKVEVVKVDEDTGHLTLKVKATEESGKIPALLQRLAERGIDPDDPEGDRQAVIASQFRETAEMIHGYLNKVGIPAAIISGKIAQKERNRLMKAFQAGELRVMCIVTAAAGVGITLNKADDVHVLDETWNPDDQEQLTDRAVDMNEYHQVTVFVYRSIDTIEQYIMEVTGEKLDINRDILDLRRQGFRAVKLEAK
jgi:SNF2 family DNA or RNA helicase